jgi:protein-S-isoprenylcysteine O-methyltransferase Ste14
MVAAGASLYLVCLASFLAANGTPAIFFTRPLRAVIGEEPTSLVRAGVYRFSRNPMYVGVLAAIFGQAIVFASRTMLIYGILTGIAFHLVVVLAEEPHLRSKQGAAYAEYCRKVPALDRAPALNSFYQRSFRSACQRSLEAIISSQVTVVCL